MNPAIMAAMAASSSSEEDSEEEKAIKDNASQESPAA